MSEVPQNFPARSQLESLNTFTNLNQSRAVLSVVWLGLFTTLSLSAGDSAPLGHKLVDGQKINPYSLSWYQCTLKEGQWIPANPLHEKLDRIGTMVMRTRQTTTRPDGGTGVVTAYYDLHTFAMHRIEQEIRLADGTKAASAEYVFDQSGYHGKKVRGEEIKKVNGSLTSGMLNGAGLGLPLASLEWQDKPLSLLSSMIGMDASYDVTATWAEKEKLTTPEGAQVEAWLIDVEWKHRELGDIYPPGPDASGGRYWIVQQPPEGFPAVVRYKTDTYVVEFVSEFCPTANL